MSKIQELSVSPTTGNSPRLHGAFLDIFKTTWQIFCQETSKSTISHLVLCVDLSLFFFFFSVISSFTLSFLFFYFYVFVSAFPEKMAVPRAINRNEEWRGNREGELSKTGSKTGPQNSYLYGISLWEKEKEEERTKKAVPSVSPRERL